MRVRFDSMSDGFVATRLSYLFPKTDDPIHLPEPYGLMCLRTPLIL